MIFFIILALYLLLILLYVITYFFIAYHLVRYSLKSPLNKIMLPVFTVISTLLLLSNLLLFFSVNWKALLAKLPL